MGRTLAAEALAIDKVLALFDRAKARDFIDLAAVVDRWGLSHLCRRAKEKDAGFNAEILADQLDRFDRLPAQDFEMTGYARTRLRGVVRLVAAPAPPATGARHTWSKPQPVAERRETSQPALLLLRRCLGGSPPSTSTRRQHPHDVASTQPDRALVRQSLRAGLVAAGQQPVLPHGPRLTASETPRL